MFRLERFFPLLEKEGWRRRRRGRCGQFGVNAILRADHPVCAASEASRHPFHGAATPPFQGGEFLAVILILSFSLASFAQSSAPSITVNGAPVLLSQPV